MFIVEAITAIMIWIDVSFYPVWIFFEAALVIINGYATFKAVYSGTNLRVLALLLISWYVAILGLINVYFKLELIDIFIICVTMSIIKEIVSLEVRKWRLRTLQKRLKTKSESSMHKMQSQ